MRRLCAIGTVVAVLAGADGAAAATWSTPANVSATEQQVGTVDIGIDHNGRALATWQAFKEIQGRFRKQYAADGWRTATRAPGGTAFQVPRAVPTFAAGPVLYGVSRAIGLDQTSLGQQHCGPRVAVRARFGDSSGTFGLPRTVTAYTGAAIRLGPVVAANDAGQMLAAWVAISGSSCSHRQLQVSPRAPNGAFGTPVTLRGQGEPQDPSVAVGAGGDGVIAWQQRTGEGNDSRTIVEARFRPAGHAWGSVVVLGHGSTGEPPVTAVAQNGRAYIAWGSPQIDGDSGLRGTFYVAVRPAGATAFRAAQKLESVSTGVVFLPRLGPLLALAGNNALVAWTGHDTAWSVRVARTDSGGRFGAPQTVSAPGVDSVLGDLAALPSGAASVSWSGLGFENLVQTVVAAYRPPGSATAFGAPETINDGTLAVPSVAMDPTTIQPTVVWPQQIGAARPSSITVFVRASNRTP